MHGKTIRLKAFILALCICTLLLHAAPAPDAAASAYIPGIDVSKFQEDIDWPTVAAYGEKFAIIRCCKIVHATGQKEFDNRFLENYEGARAAGLAVGCYLNTDAVTEAEFSQDIAFLLENIEGLSFDFPVYLDIESEERQELLSPTVFMPPLLSALSQIEAAGHTAGIYANTAFFSECIDRTQIIDGGYEIWEANYFDTVDGLSSPAGHNLSATANIWQYTGCGHTGGISVKVDRNICYTYQYFNHTVTLADAELPPETMLPGSDFDVNGTVSCAAVIRTVTGAIYNTQSEEPVQTVTVYPNAKKYTLAGFFSKQLMFSELPEGDYTLHITAVDSSGKTLTAAETAFAVAAETTTTTTTTTTATTATITSTTAAESQTAVSSSAASETLTEAITAANAAAQVRTPDAPKNSGVLFLQTALQIGDMLNVQETLHILKTASIPHSPLHLLFSAASHRADAFFTTAGLLTCSA